MCIWFGLVWFGLVWFGFELNAQSVYTITLLHCLIIIISDIYYVPTCWGLTEKLVVNLETLWWILEIK